MSTSNIKIPSEFNYFEIYLTMRCNLKCSYCINAYSGIDRKRTELSAVDWAQGINRVDFGKLPLTIGGGEPSMHKEFYTFLDLIRHDISIDLLTNLSFNLDEFIEKTTPSRFNLPNNNAYKSIRVSYHPDSMDPETLIKRARRLQEHGYRIGIFGINHPLNMDRNIQMSETARENGVYFFIKDFLGEFDDRLFGYYKYENAIMSPLKSCKCRIQEVIIDPTGKIYRCHRDLYKQVNPISNITDDNLSFNYMFRDCNYFGDCNPCDIKLKTNRFLEMGKCSVEIKYLE